MMRDLTVEQLPYMEGPMLIQPSSGHHKQHTWEQDVTSDLCHHCTVSDCSLITKC